MNNIEQKIENLLMNSLLELGYLIVRIKYNDSNKKNLQIMIERQDQKPITIEDCSKASKLCSLILDRDNPISDDYTLEVSSPGIDRPLTKINDFIRYKGFKAIINTKELLEKRKKFKGEIFDVKFDQIVFKLDNENKIVNINLDQILSAKLNDNIDNNPRGIN